MEIELAVRHRRVVTVLFWVVAAFAAINLGLHAWHAFGLYGYTPVTFLLPVFDLDAERNLPTLVEVGLLLCSAQLLLLLALRSQEAGDGTASGWWVLAAGFLLLAVDEAWSFHERLVEPMNGLLGSSLPRVLAYSWVVPGMAGVAAVAVVLARFLWRLPRRLALRLVGAGAVFIGGCIGMEMVGIAYLSRPRPSMMVYAVIATMEESLEMSGVVLLIRALLAELAGGGAILRVSLALRGDDGTAGAGHAEGSPTWAPRPPAA